VPPRLRKESKSDYHARRMNLRPGPTVVRAPALAPALALALATASCRGCHDDHPYVPYAIGSGSPVGDSPGDAAAATVASAAPVEAGADRFASEPALVAPPGVAQ
jgi:hypothetical protein